MFTLSTKSDYGLLLLSLLRQKTRKDDKFVSLTSISKESKLPYAFISRIASELSSSGILESKEGASGGYRLAKEPGEITISQVIEVLDGPWAPTKCTHKDKECNYEHLCPVAHHWQSHLKGKMWELLNSYSLRDLVS